MDGVVALVALEADACPDCGGPMDHITATQPALIRHAGYGASVETTIRICPGCAYGLVARRGEVRP